MPVRAAESDVEDELADVAGQLNVQHARLVRTVSTADRDGGWVGHGIEPIPHWLTIQLGLAPGMAKKVAAIARRFDQFPAPPERRVQIRGRVIVCLDVAVSRQGVRISWDDVPGSIRDEVERVLDARIVVATNVDGGFSPGPAARCILSDGRSVFVKAAGLALNPISPGMHRQEAAILATMPANVPAPRLIGVVDDGDWVAVVIEWIDGRMPIAPLSPVDVDRLLRLVDRLAGITGHASLQPCGDAHPQLFGHWRRLARHSLPGVDRWTLQHLDDLIDLEADVESAVAGDRLVHLDLRTDNVIFAHASDEHDVVVDWPGACLGAPWIDLVCLLPSLELDGAPPCEQVFADQRVSATANRDAVNALIAAMAGFFTRMSLLPPPPGLPTVRAFQAAQATVAKRWLAVRRGWEHPPIRSLPSTPSGAR